MIGCKKMLNQIVEGGPIEGSTQLLLLLNVFCGHQMSMPKAK